MRLLRATLVFFRSIVLGWPILIVVGLLFCWSYLTDGVPAAANWSDLWGSADHAGAALYLRDHGLWPSYLYWSPVVSESTFMLNAVWPSVILPNLFSLVTRDIWLIVKLMQAFQFVLAGLPMYWMAHEFSKDRLVSLTAALAYAFSPILFLLLRGTVNLPWTYALVPLAMLATYKAFKGGRVHQAIIAGMLVSVVSLWGHVESVFHEGIPLFIFCIMQGLLYRDQEFTPVKALLRTAWLTGLIWMTCILFAAFFLLPSFREPPIFSLRQGHVEYRSSLERTSLFSNSSIGMFYLQYAETDALPIPEFTTSDTPVVLIVVFLLISLTAFTTLLYKRDQLIVSMAVLALLSMLLSRGPFSPIPLYQLLREYVPFFELSKAPARHIFLAAAPVSYMLAYAVRSLGKKLAESTKADSRVVARSISIATILILLVAGAEYNRLDAKAFVAVPDFEGSHPDLPRVWQATRQEDPFNDYRVIDITEAYNAPPSYAPLYSIGRRILMNQYELVDRFHLKKAFGQVIGLLNVRYILTTPDWPRYWKLFPTVPQELERSTSFARAYRSDSGVTIWENRWAAPRMYVTRPALVFGGPAALPVFLGLSPDYDPSYPPYGLVFAGQLTGPERSVPALDPPYYGVLPFDADFEERHLKQGDYDLSVFYDYAPLDYVARRLAQFALLPDQAQSNRWPIVTEHEYEQYMPFLAYARLLNDSWYHSTILDQEVLSNGVVFTDTASTLALPFVTAEGADYTVYLRAWRTPSTAISLTIDGNLVGSVGGTHVPGFKWIEAGTTELDSGEHHMLVTKADSTPLYIDMLLIAPVERLNEAYSRSQRLFAGLSPQLYLYDALWFERTEGTAPVRDLGEEMLLGPGSSATMEVDLLAAGEFAVGVQSSVPGVEIRIDGEKVAQSSRVRLDAGEHVLEVHNPSDTDNRVQSVWLLSGASSITDLWEGSVDASVTWSETSMQSFHYSVSVDREALLVNTESFSQAWEMRLGDKRERAVPVNVFSNGFWVPAGESEFDVVYVPSPVRRAGLYLSALPLFMLGLCLFDGMLRRLAPLLERVGIRRCNERQTR